MINFREKKGITLIALVITIIVLLILAGVALSLVVGENGITERAINAGKTQNIAGAKEKLELDVANYASEYYQAKYVNNSLSAESTIGEYVLSKFTNGAYVDNFTIEKKGTNQIVLKSNINSDNSTNVTATIGDDGKVSWSAIDYADGTSGGGSTSTGTPAGTAIADNTHYGEYFDLGTSIFTLNSVTLEDSTHPKSDWRIFSKDSTGVWLILADYLPINGSEMNTFITGANQIGLVTKTGGDLTSYPYSVWSNTNRTDLMTRLRNDWKGILPSSLQSNTNVTAVGALTVTEWQAGWNSYYTASEDQISVSGDETNGYSTLSVSSRAGYSNTLYFPHKSAQSNCEGYWLVSPYASNPYGVINVFYKGRVGISAENNNYYGVRPAVHLASGINIEQNSTTGIWTISN